MHRPHARAFLAGSAVFLALVGLTTPIAQSAEWEASGWSGFVGRMVGFSLQWVVAWGLVLCPAALLSRRWRAHRPIRRACAVVGAGLAILPSLGRILAATGWQLTVETLTMVVSEPPLLISDWPPFVVAGAVFGTVLAGDSRSHQPGRLLGQVS